MTDGATGEVDLDEQLVRQLAERARADGLKLTGEGGLLQRLTKLVVESSLEGELDDHLGYGKHDAAGRDGGNSRNGKAAIGKSFQTVYREVARNSKPDGTYQP